MPFTIAQIAEAIGAEAVGDTALIVDRAADPAEAGADALAMAGTPAYAQRLGQGRARAAMLWDGADWRELGLEAAILPKRPRYAMAGLTRLMDPGPGFAAGIDPSAMIHTTAEIGDDVSIGPLSVIGPGARIGDGSVIGPLCFVGAQAEIGSGALLRESVSIGARVRIGARFIAQPGARIGGDGFSYVTPDRSAVENVRSSLGDQGDAEAQSYVRIHSLGGVVIGDDVEVGANATIDSGTIRPTEVGDGTKIDNLVQLGHNVVVGRHCLLCGQTGIAGSSRIGDHVVMGGQCGMGDNLFVGDRAILGGGTKVMSNVPAGRVMLGYPATRMDQQIETYKALRRLPRLLRDVAALRKAVFKSDASD